MEHKLVIGVTPSVISTHCQVKKTVWKVPWCSGHFSQSSLYGAVKGHLMGVYFSLWILLPVSAHLSCWVLKWTLALLLVLRCIYLSKEAALAVNSDYIYCCTCCKLLSLAVKLFCCGNERYKKKKKAKNKTPLPLQWFISCLKSKFTSKQLTDCYF